MGDGGVGVPPSERRLDFNPGYTVSRGLFPTDVHNCVVGQLML